MRWTVVEHKEPDEWVTDLLGPDWAERVRYSEAHHGDEEATLSGVVRAIHEVRCRRELQPQGTGQVWNPIPNSGWLSEVSIANPWVPDAPDESHKRTTFDGWIVELAVSE